MNARMATDGSDAIVIGGGVIGLSIAFELLSHGVDVLHVFPKDGDATSASRAAGAMLGAFGELTADDGPEEIEELDFRVAAQRCYPTWLGRVQAFSKAAAFEAKGTFIIANNQGVRDRDSILRMKREADARGEPAQWVEPRDVPGLSPAATHAPSLCLYLANEHAVSSGDLLDAVQAALLTRPGYKRVDAEVRNLEPEGAGWRATLANGETLRGAHAILAAGSRSLQCLRPELADAAGLPKLYFGKGVSLTLGEAPEVPHTIRTPNRAFSCGIHVVPRPGRGKLYLGATNCMGHDHEAERQVQPAELHGLFDETIHQINTRIRTARIENIRVGFRPIANFRRPVVGRTRLPNLLIATGTYRNGVLMAPLVAQAVAAEMGLARAACANPFAVGYQPTRGADNLRGLLDVGVRDIVAFIQEPRGALPYNRSCELEAYLRRLFDLAIFDDEDSVELRREIQRRIKESPFNETMHMLFYELVESRLKRSGAAT